MISKDAINLDLNVEALAKACKGDVKLLPSFMVHDDTVFLSPTAVRLDNRNRLHIRRTTFMRSVVGQVPVRQGLWLSATVQEYFFDLKPHHLQGSDDMAPAKGHKHSRALIGDDGAGRIQGDYDHGGHTLRVGGKSKLNNVPKPAKPRKPEGGIPVSILRGPDTD